MFGFKLLRRLDEMQEEIERLKNPDYGYVYILYSIQKDGSLEREGSTLCYRWAVSWVEAGSVRCFLRQELKQ